MTRAEREARDAEEYELAVSRELQRRLATDDVARRQARCSALLAAVPLEQRVEAERLFWKRVELSIAAAVAEREHELRRHRNGQRALAHAQARVRETRVAAQVLAKELSALQGREPEPHRHR